MRVDHVNKYREVDDCDDDDDDSEEEEEAIATLCFACFFCSDRCSYFLVALAVVSKRFFSSLSLHLFLLDSMPVGQQGGKQAKKRVAKKDAKLTNERFK